MDSMDEEQEEVVMRVTAHYVEAVQAGHQPAISDYLARYPQYADAIASFIAYYHAIESPSAQLSGGADVSESTANLEETGTENTGVFTDEVHIAIESSWQRVFSEEIVSKPGNGEEIALMPEIGKRGEVEDVVYGQTLQSLFVAMKQQRLSPSQLAAYLGISEDIVTLLEQQAFLPESVPAELYRRLSATLHLPVRAVQNYSGRERRQKVAEHPGKYDTGNIGDNGNMRDTLRLSRKVSFREAVNNSEKLSAEQKMFWLELLIEEGL